MDYPEEGIVGKGRRPENEEDLEFEDDEMDEEEEIELGKRFDYEENKEQIGPDEETGEDIQVDFLFLDPNQNQFFSIKSLVNGLLDGFSFRSSDLANIICDQVVVGTMIGVEGDEDRPDEKSVLGFVSALNLSVYENQPVMKEIVQYVVSKSKSFNENHDVFYKILTTHTNQIGLLINERMINLSPQLVPTLHGQLCEDINWIREQKNEDTPAFNFKYILCLSKCYKESKKPAKRLHTGGEDLVYQKFEDYAFLQKALIKFSFSAKTSKNLAGLSSFETPAEEQISERLIYLISFEDYVNCVQTLGNYLEA